MPYEEQQANTPNLLKYLPPFVIKSKIIRNLENSYAKELGKKNFFLQDLRKQFDIDSATWGLEIWEQEVGIKEDISKSLEFRRENIKAKLRAAGTVTKEMLKNVALAFTNAEVDILEYPNEYKITIKFTGVHGIPPNMAGLIETIESIKPAHLLYDFEYTFTVWDFITSKNATWNSVATKTWNELRVYS